MQHTIGILGGTGFVGRHLANRLARDGHRVRILTRRREKHRELLVIPTCELVEADVHDQDTLNAKLAGCDVAINLVGILNARGGKGNGFVHAHTELAATLIRACRHNGIRRVLQMSALNADAKDGASRYLRTKGEAEDLLHEAAAQGLLVTSFRPSVIFGPDDSFFNRFAALLRLAPVMPLACPRARFAPVYVGDVVEAFAAAIDRTDTHGRRFELCGPDTLSLHELVTMTARLAGLHRWIWPLGDGLSRLQALLMEFAPGKPFSRDNYDSLQVDSVCTDNGLERLGITPVPLSAVVPRYLHGASQRARYSGYRRAARRN